MACTLQVPGVHIHQLDLIPDIDQGLLKINIVGSPAAAGAPAQVCVAAFELNSHGMCKHACLPQLLPSLCLVMLLQLLLSVLLQLLLLLPVLLLLPLLVLLLLLLLLLLWPLLLTQCVSSDFIAVMQCCCHQMHCRRSLACCKGLETLEALLGLCSYTQLHLQSLPIEYPACYA